MSVKEDNSKPEPFLPDILAVFLGCIVLSPNTARSSSTTRALIMSSPLVLPSGSDQVMISLGQTNPVILLAAVDES